MHLKLLCIYRSIVAASLAIGSNFGKVPPGTQQPKNNYIRGMTTLQIDLLNPKAAKLLQNLADMELISIRTPTQDGFLKLVNKIRAKAKKNRPTVQEITKEVELVRASRYAKAKR